MIGVDLVEAIIGRQFLRAGRERLAEQFFGLSEIPPIGDHAFLQQGVDLGGQLAEIDRFGLRSRKGNEHFSSSGRRSSLQTPAKAGPGAASRFGHGPLSVTRRAHSSAFTASSARKKQAARQNAAAMVPLLHCSARAGLDRSAQSAPPARTAPLVRTARAGEPIERSIDDGKNSRAHSSPLSTAPMWFCS